MTDTVVSRKLTAIFYADIAGYSRLTGSDEEGTHRRAMDALDFTTQTIANQGGSVLRYAGDAILAEFSSVVVAMEASIAIQNELHNQNAGVSLDRKVLIRIGVNLGDVMEDRGEIFGDGVNLAARLESVAKPGGICISSAVFDQIDGKLDIALTDGGQERFKNIAKPVRIYRWQPGPGSGMTSEQMASSEFSNSNHSPVKADYSLRPEKPSIVVLPFANMSGDIDQEYFSDGISEDLITDISKVSGLFVIARNTAFTYKGKNVDLVELSEQLGVRYILEGSVRKMGSRVRITAQLIDGATNGHIWAERYDRNLEDLFSVQDEVTEEIVTALRVHVTDAERRRMVKKETENLDAYDLMLRARELFLKFTVEGNLDAEQSLRDAINLDPAYASAYAELARILVQRRNHGWNDTPAETLDEGFRMATKAVELDNSFAQSRIVKGFVHLWRHEHDEALTELDAGLALDPNHADGHMWKAIVAGFAGDPEQGVQEVQIAMRLNPGSPFWYFFALGNACFAMSSYKDCVAACTKAIEKNPNFIFAQMLLAASLGHIGMGAPAEKALNECRRLNPGFSLDWAKNLIPYKSKEDSERFSTGLEMAGLTN